MLHAHCHHLKALAITLSDGYYPGADLCQIPVQTVMPAQFFRLISLVEDGGALGGGSPS